MAEVYKIITTIYRKPKYPSCFKKFNTLLFTNSLSRGETEVLERRRKKCITSLKEHNALREIYQSSLHNWITDCWPLPKETLSLSLEERAVSIFDYCIQLLDCKAHRCSPWKLYLYIIQSPCSWWDDMWTCPIAVWRAWHMCFSKHTWGIVRTTLFRRKKL